MQCSTTGCWEREGRKGESIRDYWIYNYGKVNTINCNLNKSKTNCRHTENRNVQSYSLQTKSFLLFFQIAENFDMPFFEVSCKQNVNIENAFLTLARSIREQREHRVSDGPHSISIHIYCTIYTASFLYTHRATITMTKNRRKHLGMGMDLMALVLSHWRTTRKMVGVVHVRLPLFPFI